MSKFAQIRDNEVRIILIGKTGAGKSSAGNTILGQDQELCEVHDGLLSGTEQCDMKCATRNNKIIKVIDTPGVCDTHRDLNEVHREICKSVAAVVPGPHAIVMCLRCDRRFTEEEYHAYEQLKRLFGAAMQKHMIIVFNGVDALEGKPLDLKGMSTKIKSLGNILDDVGGPESYKVVILNNEADWDDHSKQGCALLDTVARLFEENGNKYFTDDIMKRVESAIEAKMAVEKKSREEMQAEILKNHKKGQRRAAESPSEGRSTEERGQLHIPVKTLFSSVY